MKIIHETYTDLKPNKDIIEHINESAGNILFFDIETTGLNKTTTFMYLIGCGYYKNNMLNSVFFFGENEKDEYKILESFFEFAKNFNTIIHFNGTKFDLPYIEYKTKKYNIDNILNEKNSFDLYREIKPLRYIIFRENMRQKTVEDFLSIKRNDKYNGGELIPIYFNYMSYNNEEDFDKLMTHNREDVIGMHKIFPIINYLKIRSMSINYIDMAINSYVDINQSQKKEIIITYDINISLPVSFSLFNNDIFYKFETNNNKLIIRVPIINAELNHYYENYNDYYYLIEEKACVHKSIADCIDKSLKVKAKKENCYYTVNGLFLPQNKIIIQPTYGYDYKTRNNYFLLPTENMAQTFNEYGHYLIERLFTEKPKKKSKT